MNRLRLLLASCISFAVITHSSSIARTWHIRSDGTGDAATIQAGVDSAGVGDTVLVAPGTYTGSTEVLIEGATKKVNVHLYKNIILIQNYAGV